MIAVVNVTHKTSPYLEPHTTQQVFGKLVESGFEARLLCSSLEPLEESLESMPELEGVIFYGLFNVRGILDEDQAKRNAIATRLREQGFQGFIVAGGHQATIDPEGTLLGCTAIDYVLTGEPEGVVLDLVRLLSAHQSVDDLPGIAYRQEGRTVRRNPPHRPPSVLGRGSPHRPYLEALSRVHPPSLLAALIETSRGCYHPGCTFCSTPVLARAIGARPFRLKPIPTVVEEMAEVMNRYDVTRFVFEDDSFCAPGPSGERRLMEYLEAIRRLSRSVEFSMILRADFVTERSRPIYEELRNSGLRLVYFGVETFSAEDLTFYDKGISLEQTLRGIEILLDLGYSIDVTGQLRLKPGLLPFHPYTRLGQIRDQSAVWKRYGITPIKMLARVELYPGTPLYERTDRDGLLAPETRAGFRFADAWTERFHRTAVAALKTIYRPRRKIREVEKTVQGLKLSADLVEPLRKERELLESAFHQLFDDCLEAGLEEVPESGFQELLNDFHGRMEESLMAGGVSARIETAWEKVRLMVESEYENLGRVVPESAPPVHFRPCWFPTIH